jgi:hypothetical protein
MREDLAAGVVTLSRIVSDTGDDPEGHFRVRARDYKLAERIALEEKVPIQVIYNPLSAVQSSDPTEGDDPDGERPTQNSSEQ